MFKTRLKECRSNANLSQNALAKLLSVSQQTIGSWETGRTSPPLDLIPSIAELFNVSADYLLGREEEPEQTKKPADGELSELSKNKKEILNLLDQVDPQKRDVVDLAVRALIQSIIDSQ